MTQGEAYLDIVWKQFQKNRGAYYSLWLFVGMFLLAIFAPLLASDQPFWFWDNGELLFPWVRALFNPAQAVDFVFNMALVGFVPWLVSAVALSAYGKRRGWPGRRRLGIALGLGIGITACLSALFALPDIRRLPWVLRWMDPASGAEFYSKLALLGLALWAPLACVSNSLWGAGGMQGRRRACWLVLQCFVVNVLVWAAFHSPDIRPTNKYWTRSFMKEEYANGGKRHGRYAPVPFGTIEQDRDSFYQPPLFRKPVEQWRDGNDGVIHLLGTDDTGRDVLVRMLFGTRIALTIGFVAVSIYLTIGIILGALAGFFGGGLDMAVSRVVEVVLLFPSFFLILTLVGLLGQSIYIIMVVIGITGWPTVARLIRGETLKQRQIDYVAAAQALGVPNLRIIFRHILPNAIAPALVAAPFGIANAIITEAGLSLLGFGVQPPAPTWGGLLQLAHANYAYWWLVVYPSIAIFITVTMFNLIGGGLRDAMDPRLRR